MQEAYFDFAINIVAYALFFSQKKKKVNNNNEKKLKISNKKKDLNELIKSQT